MKITRVKNTAKHSILESVFRGHEFKLERDEDDYTDDWYIRVLDRDGCCVYDGWWQNSHLKTMKEAFRQACDGSRIDPPKRWPKDFSKRVRQ